MSSSVLTKRNSSPYQTRRPPIRDDDIQNNNQRRSLSGRFRSLFRKNSPSPTRSTINNGRSTPVHSRQRSPSPESFRTATEAPHLRAPIISWPFGRKKTKNNRKKNKSTLSSIDISNPTYQQEHQTSIHGQNFIARTPEVTHNDAGRTQSSLSYETTTKGFRDYVYIDNTKPIHQVVVSDRDDSTPPPYVSNHSRSPSLNHQRFYDKNIEHSYHNDITARISDIEIIPIPKQEQHLVGDTPLLNSTQILVEQSPLLSRKVTQPTSISNNSNQWNSTSYSTTNNTEILSRTPSFKDVDVPKLHAPLMSSSSTSNKNKSKRISFEPPYDDDAYNSTSTVNDFVPSNQTYTNITHNSSLKPTLTNYNPYPGLNAIIEHHIRPTLGQFSPHSSIKRSISPNQTQRFDASTTTLNDFDQRKQWSPIVIKGITSSPASIHHHHDGYIRPLTPEKTSVQQPDVSIIHVNLDDLRGQSSPRTSHYQSTNSPVMYRSSTTIYTKDKHNYTDGELRTWSVRKDDDSRKVSTSYQIIPSKINNKQEEENRYENERQHQPQYSINRYSDNIMNSNLTRSSILNERDKIYDQSTRSYIDSEYTQEPLKSITPVKHSEVALRHYVLKRTDSYDGLGIIISADAETHLNHRIREIENGSPGSRAGLRKNDRIVKVNGVNIENIEFGDVLVLIKQGLTNNNLQFSVINESILL